MQRHIIAAITSVLLIGCTNDVPYIHQGQIEAQSKQEEIAYAQRHLTKKLEDECIDSFKDAMHDPSSFQRAGNFYYDAIRTGFKSTVTFSLPIRGKNAMGGLIKSQLHCSYMVFPHAGRIVFDGVSQ